MKRRDFLRSIAGTGLGLAVGGQQVAARLLAQNAGLATPQQWARIAKFIGVPVSRVQQLPPDVVKQLLAIIGY